MRWLLCAGAWLVANAAGLYVAAQTKWGPVLVVFSKHHGLHLGDVLAVLVGVALATTVTVIVWVTAPERPPTEVVVAWVLVAAVWQVSMVVSIFLAASTDWGPVVVHLWQHKPVHLGDILVVAGGVVVASVVTVGVWVGLHRTQTPRHAVLGPAAGSTTVSPGR